MIGTLFEILSGNFQTATGGFDTGRRSREMLRKTCAKNPRKLGWVSGFRVTGQAVGLAQPIETKQWSWLRGVDLNHRPLGYEIGDPRIHNPSPLLTDAQESRLSAFPDCIL